ncbi:MAG: leucyl/phenylalanyl-tRNA--protein transferase [Rhodospirillaceae bacterium]|nr:leucyl/phenylalanyl-tRNA--protein transferase [Rhodospirillaceae bacterium]
MSTPLSPDLLLKAYAIGVFPMAEGRADPRIVFVDPDRRGVLPLDEFHMPRSLRKTIKRGIFDVRCDTAFSEVLAGCAQSTPKRKDTWINPEIERLYNQLYRLGFAHSVETWRDGQLVGGLYGVALGAAFFGESMFSRETDASKVALASLVERLKRGSFTLLDTQFLTEHLARFGAREIPRELYRTMLEDAIVRDAAFPKT